MKQQQLIAMFFAGATVLLSACGSIQTLSTTSSTLDSVTPDVTLNQFVNTRIASLQKEAAIGEGENLDAFAQLLGQDDKKAFSSWLQVNYDELFTNLKQPSELISRIQASKNHIRI